jgi:hypothetical protein
MTQEPPPADTTPGLLILGEDGALYFIPDSEPTKAVRCSAKFAEEALKFVKQHLPTKPYQFAAHGKFIQYPREPVECCLSHMQELRKLFEGE